MSIFNTDEIVGIFDLTSNTVASSSLSENSAMSILFRSERATITNMRSVQICVLTINNVKVFAAKYTNSGASEQVFLQIPILGQTIQSLVDDINQTAGFVASVANNYFDISASELIDVAFSQVLNQTVYLNVGVQGNYRNNEEIKNSLQLFYTSIEPFSQQNNHSQSFGGFPSKNQIYYSYPLLETLGIYEDRFIIDDSTELPNFSLSKFKQYTHVQINDEILKISSWQNNVAFLAQRNVFDTPLRMHSAGSAVSFIDPTIILDNNIGLDRKQYRCFALQNLLTSYSIKNIKVFSSLKSRNDYSNMRIAIEVPKSNFYQGVSNSTGLTAFGVNSLVNKFATDYFKNAPLQFTTGNNLNQTRIIKSYVPSSGTIELTQPLPFEINAGDAFTIHPQQATRMRSSLIMPSADSVSEFVSLPNSDNALLLNQIQKNRNNSLLLPQEFIYIWIERSIGAESDEYINNRVSLSLSFSGI